MSKGSYLLPPGPPRPPQWFIGDYEAWLERREEMRFLTELEPIRFEQNAGGEIIEGRMTERVEDDGIPF